ncbi:dipeptidase [Sphingopyxis panaciterrulae]|uniref:Microsomal dipeptidase-like Zn-dependent dipeptidase n=1 Tax=Sphingopyxis panaciterrulae TaxID=462372 RepID=A0A7W9B2G2_9SPHN|nr:dipeptidase [Sphingopyxis panaciterrulae]MBB5705032.1 microsomal dipeptidase-like Zn-dependent dipeptidase [Sphingopyxis panaciterrulae]
MRRWILAILVLLIALAAAFFLLAPGMIERGTNKIDGKPLLVVSDHAKALHKTLTIVDLHSDSLLWSRNFLDRGTRGHMDLPRLEDGNVALQILSSTTKSPKGQNYDSNSGDTDNITALVIAQLQPVRTWNSLLERSLWHAEKLHRAAGASDGQFRAVANPVDLDALLAARRGGKAVPVGAMLSVEGLHDLEGNIDNLDKLYAAGFRMAGITHFFDNEFAGSMHGLKKGGLTPLGREVVRRMEAKGMIVDVAHCSHACVADILKMARRPVVSSHGGVQATCKVNRNLTDAEIRGVAATGGLVGIGYWDAAVCDTAPASIAKAMKHVRDLVGIDHVALGSDYDGATTVRFDTAHLAQVTQALIDAGFTDDEIRAAMGGNAIRVLRAGLVPMRATVP